MGIVYTKYGSIKFDVSKFDYTYDADSFPSDAAIDFINIILEHGDVYNAYHPNDTEDSMGHVTDTENTTFRVHAMFQDISIKDRKIHDMGLAVPGNRKLYFKPTDSLTSGGVETIYELKEGDIVRDGKLYDNQNGTGQWRVEKIMKQWWEPGSEVYRVAIVKNINLDGS